MTPSPSESFFEDLGVKDAALRIGAALGGGGPGSFADRSTFACWFLIKSAAVLEGAAVVAAGAGCVSTAAGSELGSGRTIGAVGKLMRADAAVTWAGTAGWE